MIFKAAFIFMTLFTIVPGLNAQTYFQVSHLSGSQVVGTNTVTVTSSGDVDTFNYCSIEPYWIGNDPPTNGFGSYSFSLAVAVSAIRLQIGAIDTNEFVSIEINGGAYSINPSGLSQYNGGGICTALPMSAVIGGQLTTNSISYQMASGGQLDIISGFGINSVSVIDHGGMNGAVFNFFFAQTIDAATNNGSICEGDTLKLFALSIAPGAAYSWTGPNGFYSNDQNPVIVNAGAASGGVYTLNVTAPSIIGTYTDTTTAVVVPAALIHAGVTDTIMGCGTYQDTLHGSVSNTLTGQVYSYLWSPAAYIVSGPTTLNPVISPIKDTTFTLTVTTLTDNGLCSWADSVQVVVRDSINADFVWNINFACSADTVHFQNQSSTVNSYTWSFGDGISSSDVSPRHVYAAQGIYNVQLIASNGICSDTAEKTLDTQHPLAASFIVSDDTICQGETVDFINTSVYSTSFGPVGFSWSLAGASLDTSVNITHLFSEPGHYEVMLIVRDFIPCLDTAFDEITVDPYPSVSVQISDSAICEGQLVDFDAISTIEGCTGLVWDFADGSNTPAGTQVTHAFDTSGLMLVKLSVQYRACRDTMVFANVMVNSYPVIDLGPDTSLCAGSQPIIISDHYNQFNHLASWSWNIGDTSAYIVARHPGIYTAQVTIDGCSSTDSIEVFKDCYIDIPNSFTPNGDGLNDYFFPRELLSKKLIAFKMDIYSRWGQLIFETDEIDGRGWDGKLNGVDQPDGVYIYLIKAQVKGDQIEKHQGNLTLLR